MGRASIALGAPDGSSGIMDGFVIGTHLFNEESCRGASFGAHAVGQTLSQPQAPEPTPQQQDAHEAENELARRQLWFRLSLDERAQFGSCFSRMLLKCLNDTDQEEHEVKL